MTISTCQQFACLRGVSREWGRQAHRVSPIGTMSDGNRCWEPGRAGGAGGTCLVLMEM